MKGMLEALGILFVCACVGALGALLIVGAFSAIQTRKIIRAIPDCKTAAHDATAKRGDA